MADELVALVADALATIASAALVLERTPVVRETVGLNL